MKWWNDVDKTIRAKKQNRKNWKNGGNGDLYLVSRNEARRQICLAKGEEA